MTAAPTKAPAPNLAIPAPPRPVKARRRPYVIALGVALVALGALSMVYVTSTLGRTRPVLAVTTGVARGEVIAATDLTVVDLPTGPTSLKYVPSAELDQVVGQVAATELLPGSLLTPNSSVAALEPAAGMSIVGVALTPGQMPSTTLHAGDAVRIVATAVEGGPSPDGSVGVPATVISTDAGLTGAQVVVDIEVAQGQAGQVAALSAAGQAVLVIDPIRR